MDGFSLGLRLILEHEGGYVNDPQDPGGETIFGISRRAHPEAWVAGRPSLEGAAKIYRRDYWCAAACDDLPEGLAIFLFDMAVNMGVGAAVRLLQRCVKVAEDGVLGPVTKAAVARMEEADLLADLAGERLLYYAGLPTWRRFGRGWTRRTTKTLVAVLERGEPR